MLGGQQLLQWGCGGAQGWGRHLGGVEDLTVAFRLCQTSISQVGVMARVEVWGGGG